MGCCASTEAIGVNESAVKTSTKLSTDGEQTVGTKLANKPMPSESSAPNPPITTAKPSAKANAKAPPVKGAEAAPAPGVKKVRAAYSGKGWAPPQKEWDSSKKEKGDKTKTEIEDEWDDDGNLKRTITKRTTTPDWKFKTEKTVELYSAEEAKKAGLARK